MCIFFFRTDCVFSPDDRMIITAVSMDKGGEYGKVVFFDRETFSTVYEMKIQGTVRLFSQT